MVGRLTPFDTWHLRDFDPDAMGSGPPRSAGNYLVEHFSNAISQDARVELLLDVGLAPSAAWRDLPSTPLRSGLRLREGSPSAMGLRGGTFPTHLGPDPHLGALKDGATCKECSISSWLWFLSWALGVNCRDRVWYCPKAADMMIEARTAFSTGRVGGGLSNNASFLDGFSGMFAMLCARALRMVLRLFGLVTSEAPEKRDGSNDRGHLQRTHLLLLFALLLLQDIQDSLPSGKSRRKSPAQVIRQHLRSTPPPKLASQTKFAERISLCNGPGLLT